jgi:hypothetical protein
MSLCQPLCYVSPLSFLRQVCDLEIATSNEFLGVVNVVSIEHRGQRRRQVEAANGSQLQSLIEGSATQNASMSQLSNRLHFNSRSRYLMTGVSREFLRYPVLLLRRPSAWRYFACLFTDYMILVIC